MFAQFLFSLGVYLSIDYGGYSVKMAKSEFGDVKIIKDKAGKVGITPSIYIAVGNNTDSSNPYKNVDCRFGSRAFPKLKQKPERGIQYLPMTLGRINTSYHTSTQFSYLELNRLFGRHLTREVNTRDSVIIAAIPSYWTYRMRMELTYALDKGIPIDVIEDREAVAYAYNEQRYQRYANKEHCVLFVDVGAFSTKSYGIFYKNENGTTHAIPTSASYSEDAGGMCFAQAIASKENISIKKAFKKLSMVGSDFDTELVRPCLDNMVEVIKQSINDTYELLNQTGIGDKIDEVQVLGGSLRYPFVLQTVKNATAMPVLKDLHPTESIASGALSRWLNINGEGSAPPLDFHTRPSHTVFLEYEDKAKAVCAKNRGCAAELNITDASTKPERLALFVDPRELPPGAFTVQSGVALLNISRLQRSLDSELTGRVRFTDAPSIASVDWCRAADDCRPIDAAPLQLIDPNEAVSHERFLGGLADFLDEEAERDGVYERVCAEFGRMAEEVEAVLAKKGASVRSLPADMYDRFAQFRAWVEDGSLRRRSAESLRTVMADMQILHRHIVDAAKKVKGRGRRSAKADL